jgi:polyhydroxyalkanoate synthesis regulator phasin
MTTRKAKTPMTLPERIEELQAAATGQLHEAIDFLGTEPRKVAGDLRAGLERTGRKLSQRAEKAAKSLRADVDKRRRDLTKRAEHVARDARKRAEAVVGDVRRQVESAVAPMTKRFDIASRSEVDRLRKRLDQLEKRLRKLTSPAAAGSAN